MTKTESLINKIINTKTRETEIEIKQRIQKKT